jgi:Flp pilus assembly protein TadD
MGSNNVDPSVWMQLSISLKNLGRDEEAEECIAKAKKLPKSDVYDSV